MQRTAVTRKDEAAKLLRRAARKYHREETKEAEDLLYAAAVLFVETVSK